MSERWSRLEDSLKEAHQGRPRPEAPPFFSARVMAGVRQAAQEGEGLWPPEAALKPALRFAVGAGLAAMALALYMVVGGPDLDSDLARLGLGDPTGLSPWQLLWS